MNIHIYAPPVVMKKACAGKCPDCKQRTRFLAFFYEWHGWNHTCIKCGRRWCDGEWIPLDFMRGARRDSIARAKNLWRLLTPNTIVEGREQRSCEASLSNDGLGA